VKSLKVGDVVELQLFNRDRENGEIIDKLYKNRALTIGSHHWSFPDLPLGKQQLEIVSINRNKITISSPLEIEIKPINEEAWHWYNDNIGKKKSPIVDTWWQTETGGILITPIPLVTPTKPTYATLPFIGIQPVLMDENGQELKGNQVDVRLCIKFPWLTKQISVLFGAIHYYNKNY
jgi:hypothetical protein